MRNYLRYPLFVILLMFFSCSNGDSVIENKQENETNQKPAIEALVLNESNFYNEPRSFNVIKNLVNDYGADIIFDTNDSSKLQDAINDINSLGGGKLIIPKGNYTFADIKLKSNVHIVIDDKVIIRPNQRANQDNFNIFSFGANSNTVENVSISSNNGKRYKIDLTQTNNINVAAFAFNNVDNFLLSDFEIDDVLTDFSGAIFGITPYGGDYFWPRNGVVKNGNINDSDYGYGLIQAQAASNIYFKDISGTGGVTLRLETGWKIMNNLQVGGVHDIFAENVSCTDGNAALMFSPHAMKCGKVYVNGVKAVSCGFGVRIEKGFVSAKYSTPNLVNGIFEEVTLLNIEASYHPSRAQIKPKHYDYMPCSLRSSINSQPIKSGGKSYNGPSISGVIYVSNYPVNFIENNVITNGFTDNYEVVTVDESKTNAQCN